MNYIRYSSATLKKIGSSAKLSPNYSFFHTTTPIRAWIIALGIRAGPCPFRRSRAGTHSYYHIASITYRWHGYSTHRSSTTPVHSANHDNLLPIKTINNCSKLQSPVFSAPRKNLHSALINCRSMVNKTQDIQLELVRNNLDLCILTETWIREDDITTPGRLCPNGYKALSVSRHGRTSGGFAIVYKNNLNINITKGQPLETMESTCFSINTGFKAVSLIVIYRPPDSNALEFCNELANLLESKINSSNELILLGDFNIAVDKPSEAVPSIFLDMLNSFNLINRVDKPTHRLSNTLDLIIHDADSNVIPSIKIGRLFSDHNIVLFDIYTPCTVTKSAVRLYRKLKNINPAVFMEDVEKLCLKKPSGLSLEDKTNHYFTMLRSTLDHHAPIKSRKCSNRPKIPWFTDRIAEAIRLRRSLERTWHRDRSNAEAYTLFCQQCRLMSNLLDKAERDFFWTSITENSSNYKRIYEICNHLLGRTKDSPMPPGVTNKDLACRFNNFFIDKITKICNDLIGKQQHLPLYVKTPAPLNTSKLCRFQPITLSNLQKLIRSTPNKSCDLDPIPTNLLKQILPSIVTTIADIINTSLKDV